ncbi:ead/Ea22-like family protein [Citrobacter freundii]|uniref:ead/Ea22-like family protein n=1 Tax=Citrobacter freundii TaxID=546 RepID=UPI003988F6B9
MTALNKQAIDFSQPLDTESGEPVKYICHDVIEYKCARVCVDIATGVVYSSPYVGLKIRNKEANPRAKLREQIESAADAYWQFDNGWISDMKCGDLSHEYLLFAKEPKNVLALLDELEAAEKRIAELEARTVTLPPTFWYEHDDLSRDIQVLDKRLVKKAIRAAGIGVKGE